MKEAFSDYLQFFSSTSFVCTISATFCIWKLLGVYQMVDIVVGRTNI